MLKESWQKTAQRAALLSQGALTNQVKHHILGNTQKVWRERRKGTKSGVFSASGTKGHRGTTAFIFLSTFKTLPGKGVGAQPEPGTGLLRAAAAGEHCLGLWSVDIRVFLCSHVGKASYTNRVCIMAKVEDEIVPAYALWQVKASQHHFSANSAVIIPLSSTPSIVSLLSNIF